MSIKSDSVIGVIGAGIMGSGIAQVAATAGNKVIVFDADTKAAQRAADSMQKTFSKLTEKGKLTGEKAKEISSRISYSSSLNEFKECSLIIEAIIEDLTVKQKVFSDLERVVGADCVLATNTSSLSVTSIASACANPERVVGIHFFNPAPLMPLVEIVGGLASDEQIVKDAKSLIDSWGKITVLAKDTPGFIVNRIARPFYGEAILIYEEGLADFATIDWAMKEIGGFKMGPFELMDMIGNDVNYTVTETVWKQFFYDPRYKPSITQKRLFEAKRFGKKSGIGYYDYSEGSVVPSPVMNKQLGEIIFYRINSMLINEAIDALYFNVASKEDIDLAMMKGVNYPKGLLRWCDEIGAEKIYERLNVLRTIYGERYRPSVLLRDMVMEGRKIYE